MSASAPREAPDGTSWRPVTILLLLVAGALLVAAIALRDPVPLFLAVPLLLAPVAHAFLAPAPEGRASLEWSVRGTGSEVEVVGSLTAPAGMRGADLRIDVVRPPSLTEVGPPDQVADGNRVDLHYHWWTEWPCILSIDPPTVVWQDSLGLASRPVTVDAPQLSIERYPPEIARVGRARLRRTTPQPGEVRSRRVGASGEFYGVRAAAPGDTSRQINWRATARSGTLLANDFQLERTGDLLILLDLRPSSLGPVWDAEVTSVSRAAALGIASRFLAEKNRVGVGLYSEFLDAVPLGSGRIQRYRIAGLLRTARPSVESSPPERLAVAVRRQFPPGITTLLISPMTETDDTLVILRSLHQRGFHPVVLSPSRTAFRRDAPQQPSEDDMLVERLAHLSRRLDLAQVWEEAPVVEWDDLWSLAPLIRFFSTPPRVAGGRS